MSGIRLTRRVAEEMQLLSEEKWITETLKKVKKQRNCLQIERLHLEGMKAQLKIDLDKKGKENKPQSSNSDIILSNPQTPTIVYEVPVLDEESCNKEKLNLAVDENMFGNSLDITSFNMEEEEDEDDSNEDVFIDMNMLMNGEQITNK